MPWNKSRKPVTGYAVGSSAASSSGDLVPRAGRKKGHPEQIGRLEQAEESFVHQAIGLSCEEVSQSFAGLGSGFGV